MSTTEESCYKCGKLNPDISHTLRCTDEYIECCGKLWKKRGISTHRKGKNCNYLKTPKPAYTSDKPAYIAEKCALCGFIPDSKLKTLDHRYEFHKDVLNIKRNVYMSDRKLIIANEEINNAYKGLYRGAYTSAGNQKDRIILWEKHLAYPHIQSSKYHSAPLNRFDSNNHYIQDIISEGVKLANANNIFPRCVCICTINKMSELDARYVSMIIKNYEFIETIDISGMFVGNACFNIITQALFDNTSLKKLCADNSAITSGGMECISIALKNNYTLEYLSIESNYITDYGASFIANALISNQVLRYLNIGNCCIRDTGLDYLRNALNYNSTLTDLNISNNMITDEGCYHIASIIQNNKSILSLNISDHEITNDSIICIISALAENNTLLSINLNNNLISDMDIISNIISSNNTLTDLYVLDNPLLDTNLVVSSPLYCIESALQYNTSIKNLYIHCDVSYDDYYEKNVDVYDDGNGDGNGDVYHIYDLKLGYSVTRTKAIDNLLIQNKELSNNNKSLLSTCMDIYR